MSKIIPFSFEKLSVRVITGDNGEPLFVGKDICDALGYKNHNDAMNDHCRGVAKRYPIPDALGRMQETRVIEEPDMMRLVVNSQLPSAQAFEKLVFETILPTVRKTGAYLPEGVTLESLPPALATQIGGIIKAVIKKQNEELEVRVATGFALALAANREEFNLKLKEVMAGGGTALRHGKTAGQFWKMYGFAALKGASPWFSRRLTELGCQIDGNGCSESGGIPSKLFDPDKVAIAMKGGLQSFCKQYVQQRGGQAPLFPKAA